MPLSRASTHGRYSRIVGVTPLLMNTKAQIAQEGYRPRVLRFEAKWLKEARFKEMVQGAWGMAGNRVQTNNLASNLVVVHKQLSMIHKGAEKHKSGLRGARQGLEVITRQC